MLLRAIIVTFFLLSVPDKKALGKDLFVVYIEAEWTMPRVALGKSIIVSIVVTGNLDSLLARRSECQQRHATILHHGILNLMFNAVNHHTPSQIHIYTHTKSPIPSAAKTFSPTGAYRKRTRKSINNLSDSIRIIILILISFQQLSFEQALSKLRICWWQILSTDK